MPKKIENKKLVAVYGTLRKGEGNYNRLLKGGIDDGTIKYLVTMQSRPVYSMFNMGWYPAITEKGTTSVTLEIYLVPEHVVGHLDVLEGYVEGRVHNLYNKGEIETPYGNAIIYLYGDTKLGLTSDAHQIIHGDWMEFRESTKVT